MTTEYSNKAHHGSRAHLGGTIVHNPAHAHDDTTTTPNAVPLTWNSMPPTGDPLTAVLVNAATPTAAILIGILINDRRLRRLSRSFDRAAKTRDAGFDELNTRIDDMRSTLLADLAGIANHPTRYN